MVTMVNVFFLNSEYIYIIKMSNKENIFIGIYLFYSRALELHTKQKNNNLTCYQYFTIPYLSKSKRSDKKETLAKD